MNLNVVWQVNWARWLISWTLELKDSKCRPKGSPPGDSALASLANQICSFPTHVPGCKFAEFASRVAPRPVSEVCHPPCFYPTSLAVEQQPQCLEWSQPGTGHTML